MVCVGGLGEDPTAKTSFLRLSAWRLWSLLGLCLESVPDAGFWFCKVFHYSLSPVSLPSNTARKQGWWSHYSILITALLLVRFVALVKSKFWEGWNIRSLQSWRPTSGFTVQFSLSVIPAGTLPTVVASHEGIINNTQSGAEEGRLIETWVRLDLGSAMGANLSLYRETKERR